MTADIMAIASRPTTGPVFCLLTKGAFGASHSSSVFAAWDRPSAFCTPSRASQALLCARLVAFQALIDRHCIFGSSFCAMRAADLRSIRLDTGVNTQHIVSWSGFAAAKFDEAVSEPALALYAAF